MAMAALACFFSGGAPGQNLPSVPYGMSWSYLETENFKVIYHQGADPLARRAAAMAELVHRRLSKTMGWRPKDRTRLLILDNTDQANAVSLAFPRNTIIIYPVPPSGETGNYLDWLYELLLHEYAHILHIDRVSGLMSDLRSVFGRVIVPNALQPMSQLEGMAVYAESRFSSMGRNNSALTDGILRTVAAEGAWPTIDRASVFNSRWPWDAPYLFGGKFTQFLADSFGEASLGTYSQVHGGQIVPFMQNRPASKTFGNSLDGLWVRWRDRSIGLYRRQSDSLSAQAAANLERITENGHQKSGLAVSPDAGRIAYYARDGLSHPGIMMREVASGRTTMAHRGIIDGGISFSADGRSLYFGQLDYVNDRRELSCDLYRLDAENGRAVRLTRGWRARDPVPSPDGKSLYFTTTRLGQGALCRLKIEDMTVDTLVGFEDSSAISNPAISPDGRTLALSVWTGEGYQDIYLWDLEKGGCRPIITDRAQDIQPRWSPDGRALYFSSDRSGVWNIYRWERETGRLYKATDQIGGAFWPAPAGDTLWSVVLTGRGYEIARAVADSSVDYELEFEDRYFYAGPLEAYDGPSRPYRFWNGLLPAAWLPSGFADKDGGHLGGVFFGADDLMRHYYLAALAPGKKLDRWYYDAVYSCRSLPVGWDIRASDYVLARKADGRPLYYERRREAAVGASKTFGGLFRRVSLGLGLSRRNYSGEYETPASADRYWQGRLARANASASYSSTKRYKKSISPEDGLDASFSAGFYRKSLGSDVSLTWMQGELAGYLPLLLANHVLMGSAKAGRGYTSGAFIDEFYDEFRVRGRDGGPLGRQKTKGTIEARFPVCRVERGRGTWPVFLHVIHGALFAEAGWGGRDIGDMGWNRMDRSLGAEIRADWTVFYAVDLQAGLGLARTLGEEGGLVPYLSLSTPLSIFHGLVPR